jgi:hypothetical protein
VAGRSVGERWPCGGRRLRDLLRARRRADRGAIPAAQSGGSIWFLRNHHGRRGGRIPPIQAQALQRRPAGLGEKTQVQSFPLV